MARSFNTRDSRERADGFTMAAAVIRRGGLVIVPTESAYAVAADAFNPDAVHALLRAKRRPLTTPVSVMVGSPKTLEGICDGLTDEMKVLAKSVWPGALTIVARQQPSLSWDLGETRGTVSVRMPLHPVAIELLQRTGPLAVMVANAGGGQAPRTAVDAQAQLGDSIEVVLDAGERLGTEALSTIVDLTGATPTILRQGALPLAALAPFLPGLVGES